MESMDSSVLSANLCKQFFAPYVLGLQNDFSGILINNWYQKLIAVETSCARVNYIKCRMILNSHRGAATNGLFADTKVAGSSLDNFFFYDN